MSTWTLYANRDLHPRLFASALRDDRRLVRRGEHFVLDGAAEHGRRLMGLAPARADGSIRLEAPQRGAWLELTPLDRYPIEGRVRNNAVVYPEAAPDADVIITLRANALEEFVVLRSAEAPAVARYRVALGPDVAVLEDGDYLEARDVTGRVLMRTTPAMAVDAAGARLPVDVRLRRDDSLILEVAVDVRAAELPVVVDPQWVAGPGWPEGTVVALNSMYLDEYGRVVGHVAVLDQAPPAMLGTAEAHLAFSARITGHDLWADDVFLDADADVDGTMHCNDWSGHGSAGQVDTPLSLPLDVTVPAMPAFAGNSGTTTVQSDTLQPGRYGTFVITGGDLQLQGPGVFELQQLELQAGSRLVCIEACEVRVAGRLIAGASVRLGSTAMNVPLDIFVKGWNVDPDDPSSAPAVLIDDGVFVGGRIHAPNGTIAIGDDALAYTKLVGRDVFLGRNAYVEDDEWPDVPDCSTYCDKVLDAACANGPPNEAACVQECEDLLTYGFCQYQTKTYVSCAADAVGDLECDATTGLAYPPSFCLVAYDAFDTCQYVCGQVDDDNPCTTDECQCTPVSCDPSTSFVYFPVPSGTSCEDGDPCNGLETCNGSSSCLSAPPGIDDGNPCTEDACDPMNGPTHTPLVQGISCTDGDACNGAETCDGSGTCQPGTPLTVDDGDPTTIDLCDAATGAIGHTPIPPNDLTVATGVFDSTAFLFTGQDPPQTGVQPGTISPARAAVVRGHIREASTAPPYWKDLASVQVRVLGHEEFGSTLTQLDGWFTMVVNGGGSLTFVLEKPGYVPVHRRVDVPWHDWAFVDDAFMKRYAPVTAEVVLGSAATEMQVVHGSVAQDSFGVRRPTLFVAPGTEAIMHLPDETTQGLSAMHVRITEFTTGPEGPDAMPADLPPTSAYTYALELSVDEAVTAGATSVTFDRPVILYLENFYGFASGLQIPVGYYDRERGSWVPMHDGVIVKFVGVNNGMARLDLDGDDVEDDASYAAVGVTAEERMEVAKRYAIGQTLWRAAIDHFTPCDPNFIFDTGHGDDECSPGDQRCGPLPKPRPKPRKDKPCETHGSIIECQNQVVGQSIPLKGTEYSLRYSSDRVLGFSAGYQLEIPLVGDYTLPVGITDVLVDIRVAGRRFEASFPCEGTPDPHCESGASYSWSWDGRDSFDRIVQGPQWATVRVGHGFRRDWAGRPITVVSGSAGSGSGGGNGPSQLLLGGPEGGPVTFGAWPEDASFTAEAQDPFFIKYAVWRTSRVQLGNWNSIAQGLGGFNIDVHHAYSPSLQMLLRGDGRSSAALPVENIIELFAGGGTAYVEGASAIGNAIGFSVDKPGIDVAPDGTLYFAGFAPSTGRLMRIAPDGTVHGVTALRYCGDPPGGDGGPAAAAQMCPSDVSVAVDGSVYVTDTFRIRRIDPDGLVSTFAGDGTYGSSGDGGLAVDAQLMWPQSVASAANGDVFILDRTDGTKSVVRRVGTGGLISRVAGGCGRPGQTCQIAGDCCGAESTCNGGLCGAGPSQSELPSLAIKLDVHAAGDIDIGPDGSLYIADTLKHIVYRITPDGYADVLAGQFGVAGTSGNGGPGSGAQLRSPHSVSAANEGSLYIGLEDVSPAPGLQPGIRRVGTDGIITAVAGTDVPGCSTELCNIPGPPAAAEFFAPWSLDSAPDGTLYAAAPGVPGLIGTNRIYRIHSAVPDVSIENILVASESGAEIYVFDPTGRHLSTRDARTGAYRHTFGYNDGLLATITNVDGLETQINRDGAGNPTTIIGPHGHTTTLGSPDANGYITTVTPPLVQPYVLGYSATSPGLLESFTDPEGNEKTYEYSTGSEAHGLGGLLAQTTEAGGTRTFTRTSHNDGTTGFRVELAGATNPTTNITKYDVTEHVDGAETWTVISPAGVTTTTVRGEDGTRTTTHADGTVVTLSQGADPRFLMQAPVPQKLTVQTGATPVHTRTVQTARSVTLADPNDLLSLETSIETVCLNGSLSGTTCTSTAGGTTTLFDATATPKTETMTTNAGRVRVTELDGAGRPTLVHVVSSVIPLADLEYIYDDGSVDPLKQGQLKTIVLSTAGDERTYQLGYDGAGNLETVTDPLGRTVTWGTDGATRRTSQTSPENKTVTFGYDGNDQLTSLDPPGLGAANLHAFGYDGAKLLETYTAPDVGLPTQQDDYQYNADRQLDLVTLNDGSTIDPIYDDAGRLDAIDVSEGTLWTLDYGYHPSTGKLDSIASSLDNVTLTFGYDGALLETIEWTGTAVSGTVTFGYDDAFRLTSEQVENEPAIAFAYGDADGLLTAAGALSLVRDPDTGLLTETSLTEASGTVTDDVAINPFGELESYAAQHGATPLYQVTYERDALGRVERKSETIQGLTTHYAYLYNQAGRLAQAYEGTVPCDPPSTCVLVGSWGYDDNGNRTADGATSCTHDEQDRLDGCGATTYLYTDWGALAQKTDGTGTTTYDYDVLGNLRTVTTPLETIEYVMDGRGRRVARKVNGQLDRTWLYRDRLSPIAELDGQGAVQSVFVYGTRRHVPDYMMKGGHLYRFIVDQLGSVRLVVEVDDGTIAQRMDYDAWGHVVSELNAGFQPFGYAGGLYDPITELVRFGKRDYDAATGRWTAKDRIGFGGGSTNLYTYVDGDPINYLDSSGTFKVTPPPPGTGVGAGLGLGAFGALLASFAGGFYVGWEIAPWLLDDWIDSLTEVEPIPDDPCDVGPKTRPKPNLNRCLDACEQGAFGLAEFCRSIKDPKTRKGCWSRIHESVTNCRGWCFENYGS
jgi:RHS repeat-associated protein